MYSSLASLFEAFKYIIYELIIVEWNPDLNRPSLRQRIQDMTLRHLPTGAVKIVTVPKGISEQQIGDRGFHEMAAKNVGIRRAVGNYVLCTNPDVLWPRSMETKWFSNSQVLRADRISVANEVLTYPFSYFKCWDYCLKEINHRGRDEGAAGDFTAAHAIVWEATCGYPVVLDAPAGVDQYQLHTMQKLTGCYDSLSFPIYHVQHPGKELANGYAAAAELPRDPDWGLAKHDLETWSFL